MNPLDPDSYGIPSQIQEVSVSRVRRSFEDPSDNLPSQLNSSLTDDPYNYSSQPKFVFPLSDGQENFDTRYQWSNNSSFSLVNDQSQTAQWTRQGVMESFGPTSARAEHISEVAFTEFASHETRAGRPKKQPDSEVSQSSRDKRRTQGEMKSG
ncbi:hypothetical protein V866_005611 [Kwoniella sp. B9012]